MGALIALTQYLERKNGINYVLSGKLMSDPIEARFGMYRQSNGGNFYMSVNQVLTAEKKIRCLSLLQQQTLCTELGLNDIDHLPMHDISLQSHGQGSWLFEFLQNMSVDDLSDSDAAVSYYVSGYIGRAISRRRHCLECKNILVLSNDDPELVGSIPDKYKTVLQVADRGGLSEPSELCFMVTTLAVQYFSAISANSDIMKKLMCCQNQREVFVNAVRQVAESSAILGGLLFVECDASHNNFDLITQTAFNCFAKNELKRMNSKSIPEDMPARKQRKIRKLSSKGSCKQ